MTPGSAYRRSDYVTSRHRDQQGPLSNPLPPMRPIWQDLASAAVLVALLGLLAWWH